MVLNLDWCFRLFIQTIYMSRWLPSQSYRCWAHICHKIKLMRKENPATAQQTNKCSYKCSYCTLFTLFKYISCKIQILELEPHYRTLLLTNELWSPSHGAKKIQHSIKSNIISISPQSFCSAFLAATRRIQVCGSQSWILLFNFKMSTFSNSLPADNTQFVHSLHIVCT